MSDFSRRKFLKTGATALAGITIAPNSILGMSHGHISPSDKLNILGIGIGGRGASAIRSMSSQNIIGLCDGNIADMYLMNTLKQNVIMIIAKCLMNWANQRTL
jgi:cell division GTPase FtsZ